MRFINRVPRLIAAGSMVAALGLVGAVMPANAAGVGGGVNASATGGPVAPINPNQQLVHVECTATAYYLIASTTIEECSLYANNVFVTDFAAGGRSFSGNAAVVAGVATTPRLATLKVCYNAKAQPNGPTGPQYDPPRSCTIVNGPVTAGVSAT